ncbi:MAG: hypothetical protein RR311_17095 [Comamonas sp.]
MKIIHYLSFTGVIVAIGLLFADFSKIAGLVLALATVVELVMSVAMGKQSNEGSR